MALTRRESNSAENLSLAALDFLVVLRSVLNSKDCVMHARIVLIFSCNSRESDLCERGRIQVILASDAS